MSRDFTRLQSQIEQLLRVGVIVSGITLAVGLLMTFGHLSGAVPLMKGGLIVLMTLPCARIAASFADALRRNDRVLAISTAIVLLVMAASLAYSLSVTR
jgi:uncharacterized membrane protein